MVRGCTSDRPPSTLLNRDGIVWPRSRSGALQRVAKDGSLVSFAHGRISHRLFHEARCSHGGVVGCVLALWAPGVRSSSVSAGETPTARQPCQDPPGAPPNL